MKHFIKSIYNKTRKFEYVFVTVKEDFNKEFNVKSDGYGREDLFPVIKVNQFARIQTDNYPYHFLTSLYFKRENPTTLLKMTTASQEWCGNTFKEFLLKEGDYIFHYHSYFDGEELVNEYPVLFEDQLIYTLRALIFKEGLSFECKVISSQVSNRAIHPKIYEAVFEVKRDEIKQDTSHVSCWRIDVKLEQDKLNQYFFAEEYPNIPLQYVSWDERKLKLKGFDRYAYWKR